MAKVSCVNCSKKISDQTLCCPNCGFPLSPEKAQKVLEQKRKRDFQDSPEDPNPIIKETKHQDPNQKATHLPEIITIIIILILFLIKIIANYKSSDDVRHENGSNYNGNSKNSTERIKDSIFKAKQESIDAAYRAKESDARLDSINAYWSKKNNGWDKTKAGKIQKEHPEWSMQECEDIAENRYWIGMTIQMLIYERGKPYDANPSNYGDGVKWQWCWSDHRPSCFYGGSDGIITAYN